MNGKKDFRVSQKKPTSWIEVNPKIKIFAALCVLLYLALFYQRDKIREIGCSTTRKEFLIYMDKMK